MGITVTFKGTSGDDSITGTGYPDTFNMRQGGNDTIAGGAGDDVFDFGAMFTANDSINGGAGNDKLLLNGDYTGANELFFGPYTMSNVETIAFAAGHSYRLSLNGNETLAAGQTLTFNASALGAGDNTFLDTWSEIDCNQTVLGGAGDDIGLFNTTGHIVFKGGGGNDSMRAGTSLKATDQFDGGDGSDSLIIEGDYSAGLKFHASTLVNVEGISVNAAGTYNLTMVDANVAAGQNLDVSGDLLAVGSVLTFNGSAEKDGTYFIGGGADNDTLIGGQAGNTFSGGLGSDRMTAGAGADTFLYFFFGASESTGATRDIIKWFDTSQDSFDLSETVAAVDPAITSGTLRMAHFDTDLAAVVDSTHLAAGDAVVFYASVGSLAGHVFLVVDANGTAGYQTGADYVMELTSAKELGGLNAGNFI